MPKQTHRAVVNQVRLDKQTYNTRIFNITCAYLRLRRRGLEHDQVPVSKLVLMYGFTHNFSKTEKLTEGLRQTYNWVCRERAKKESPSKERIINMIMSFL